MRAMNTVLWAAVMAGLILAVEPATAKVDVKVEFDKKFNFNAVHTWGWSPQGAGDVKMARTKDDDPDAVRKVAEPIIKDAVSQEIGKRIRADVQPFVSAVDPELPDPVAVDEGGAGMRDWMAADEGANGLVSHRSLRGGATRRARAAWACRQS